MNELQIFNSEEFGNIRTTEIDGQPYFVGKDIADVLGYTNPSKALSDHVDEDDKLNNESLSSLGQRGGWLINESGLYSLVLSSKLPNAKKFKRWVTSEVLPSIRKTGGYHLPQTYSEALRELADMAEQKEKLMLENEQMKPKAEFADAITSSDSSILVRDLSKLIKQNGIEIGERRLYRWLREHEYVCKTSTMPTQKSMELGLFEIHMHPVDISGMTIEKAVSRVTGKGQMYFINKFLKMKESINE